MKELGEYLKRTRISSGLSVTEVCEDLDFSSSLLENMESGNVKAFKDVYSLRDLIKKYANYLGLDADKVLDEFNDFLFQHTTKISLDDIVEEEKKQKDNVKKIQSPYTITKKKRVNLSKLKVIVVWLILVLLLIGIVILVHKPAKDKIVTELVIGSVI